VPNVAKTKPDLEEFEAVETIPSPEPAEPGRTGYIFVGEYFTPSIKGKRQLKPYTFATTLPNEAVVKASPVSVFKNYMTHNGRTYKEFLQAYPDYDYLHTHSLG
jgi:hypothetical protein